MRLARKFATSVVAVTAAAGLGLAVAPPAMADGGNATLPNSNSGTAPFVPPANSTYCTQRIINELLQRVMQMELNYQIAIQEVAEADTVEALRAANQAETELRVSLWAANSAMNTFVEQCKSVMRDL
ncbi:hypothetical protein [Streptomyces nogalater]|uniref:Secreted protein n=1 Tax=Streptomyces nogalater TaxID=38314 RepID=A0ABW0WC88_STRNO